MATDDQQVLVTGVASTPATFTIPGNGQIRPKSVFAHFDGSAAASAFLPVVKITSDGGELIAICPTTQSVAAGGSADVTWFQGVGGGGGGHGLQALIGARLQATNTQSIPDGTNTNLVYQSVLFDTDGMANLGADNRILTVNTAGLYLVVCETQWAFNTAGRRINVALHNAYYTDAAIPDVDSQSSNVNAIWTGNGRSSNVSVGIYRADAGDFFSSGAYQGSGGNLNANGFANCFLSAVAIGVF